VPGNGRYHAQDFRQRRAGGCSRPYTLSNGSRRSRSRALAVLAGTQPRHRARLDWQRRPPGDAPGTHSRLRVVGDPREPPAQLDSSRQFSVLVEDSADRGSIGLGDNEHPGSMAARTEAGKARLSHCAHAGCVRASPIRGDRLTHFMVSRPQVFPWVPVCRVTSSTRA
jgi:hypothetical protein